MAAYCTHLHLVALRRRHVLPTRCADCGCGCLYLQTRDKRKRLRELAPKARGSHATYHLPVISCVCKDPQKCRSISVVPKNIPVSEEHKNDNYRVHARKYVFCSLNSCKAGTLVQRRVSALIKGELHCDSWHLKFRNTSIAKVALYVQQEYEKLKGLPGLEIHSSEFFE